MDRIGAIVLAAGLSSRMGSPKVLLPWNGKTIIESIIANINACSVSEIVVVTGGLHEKITALLDEPQVKIKVKTRFNPQYENGEMLTSFQVGLSSLSNSEAGLIVLGDQPQIRQETFQKIINSYSGQAILIPSFDRRRGHPWIIHQSIWPEILNLKPPQTLRDVLNKNSEKISYLSVDDPEILRDIDTPQDYKNMVGKTGRQ